MQEYLGRTLPSNNSTKRDVVLAQPLQQISQPQVYMSDQIISVAVSSGHVDMGNGIVHTQLTLSIFHAAFTDPAIAVVNQQL